MDFYRVGAWFNVTYYVHHITSWAFRMHSQTDQYSVDIVKSCIVSGCTVVWFLYFSEYHYPNTHYPGQSLVMLTQLPSWCPALSCSSYITCGSLCRQYYCIKPFSPFPLPLLDIALIGIPSKCWTSLLTGPPSLTSFLLFSQAYQHQVNLPTIPLALCSSPA